MQRDVKVGLVLGVLLVAVVAVVFFRRDEGERDKFTKLLPAPEAVADRARDILGPAATDPYPVAPEYLAESWQAPKPKSARMPSPARSRVDEPTAQIESVTPAGSDRSRTAGEVPAVLQPPQFDARAAARSKTEPPVRSRTDTPDNSKSGPGTEYVIQEGDTLSEIARRELGSALLWTQIYNENRHVLTDPAHIPAGRRIRLPAKPDRTVSDRVAAADSYANSTAVPTRAVRPSAPDPSQPPAVSAGTYVVRDGDTLIDIAIKHYRRDSMYLEILRANDDKISNPSDIRPGMVLRLP